MKVKRLSYDAIIGALWQKNLGYESTHLIDSYGPRR